MSEKYEICSVVFLLLLTVRIAKCPCVPVEADVMRVVPWGCQSFHLGGIGLMRWQELGAGVAGASLSAWPAVQSLAWLFVPGSSLPGKQWKRVDMGARACFPVSAVLSAAACVAGCVGSGTSRIAHPALRP